MRFILVLLLMLNGNVAFAKAPAASGQPVEVTADTLTVDQQQQTATFSGNVVAIQGNITLKSDSMVVHYSSNAEKKSTQTGAISKLEAVHHVVLTTAEEIVQGDKGTYDVVKKQVQVIGNVIITRGENIVRGDRLVYDLNSKKSQLFSSSSPKGNQASPAKGRVKGVFLPGTSEKK